MSSLTARPAPAGGAFYNAPHKQPSFLSSVPSRVAEVPSTCHFTRKVLCFWAALNEHVQALTGTPIPFEAKAPGQGDAYLKAQLPGKLRQEDSKS